MGSGGTEPADDNAFCCGNGNDNYHLGRSALLYIKESYKLLRG
jgi:hypothetical protein